VPFHIQYLLHSSQLSAAIVPIPQRRQQGLREVKEVAEVTQEWSQKKVQVYLFSRASMVPLLPDYFNPPAPASNSSSSQTPPEGIGWQADEV
jgi:hypothetical protein